MRIALGADGLEFDVQLSADGVAVVIHDQTLDRTTDRTGPVSALTAAELARVDAGYRFEQDGAWPFRGQGHGVPTLDAAPRARLPRRGLLRLGKHRPERVCGRVRCSKRVGGDLGCLLNIEGKLRRLGDESTRVAHFAELLAGDE